MKTGRPVRRGEADWYASPKNVYPSWSGAHTWNPMSYSAADPPGLHSGHRHAARLGRPAAQRGRRAFPRRILHRQWDLPDDTYDAADLKRLYGPLPELADHQGARKVKPVRELLRAWDPVAGRTVWEHETSSGHARLRRRRDVHGGKSRVPGPRQRRTLGVCRRHGQGAEGHQDRQPYHGGAHDLLRSTASST